jgi:hypothetical protein
LQKSLCSVALRRSKTPELAVSMTWPRRWEICVIVFHLVRRLKNIDSAPGPGSSFGSLRSPDQVLRTKSSVAHMTKHVQNKLNFSCIVFFPIFRLAMIQSGPVLLSHRPEMMGLQIIELGELWHWPFTSHQKNKNKNRVGVISPLRFLFCLFCVNQYRQMFCLPLKVLLCVPTSEQDGRCMNLRSLLWAGPDRTFCHLQTSLCFRSIRPYVDKKNHFKHNGVGQTKGSYRARRLPIGTFRVRH